MKKHEKFVRELYKLCDKYDATIWAMGKSDVVMGVSPKGKKLPMTCLFAKYVGTYDPYVPLSKREKDMS